MRKSPKQQEARLIGWRYKRFRSEAGQVGHAIYSFATDGGAVSTNAYAADSQKSLAITSSAAAARASK
jgi:hypothetical protein